jgi:hypothetical protein
MVNKPLKLKQKSARCKFGVVTVYFIFPIPESVFFCLVDGESTSNAFSVEIDSTKTFDGLKELIKADQSPIFDDITANSLTLWRISIPVVSANKYKPVVLNEYETATELEPTDDLSDVFEVKPPKKTIHIIVQRPPPGNAKVLCSHSYLAHELVSLY